MIKSKHLLKSLIISATITALLASVGNAAVTRPFAGNDRFDTTIKIAAAGWTSAENVILASGRNQNLVDALTSAPLAYKLNAPILLTNGSSLDAAMINELKSLGVKNVYITSGESAVAKSIDTELYNMGIDKVTRLGGQDRYQTAINIANQLDAKGRMMIARADAYADALSAAAIAAKEGIPILLTAKDSLIEPVKNYVISKNVTKTYVLGLAGAVSDAVSSQLPGVTRLGGQNRYETNVAIVKEFEDWLDFDNIYVASGEPKNLVDALAGSPLAAAKSAPLILTSSTLSDSALKYLKTVTKPESNIQVFGGIGAVPETVSSQIDQMQKGLVPTVVKAQASVKSGSLDIIKEIKVAQVGLSSAVFYRVAGSNKLIRIGDSATLVVNLENPVISFYSAAAVLVGKGELNVAKDGDVISFDVRSIK